MTSKGEVERIVKEILADRLKKSPTAILPESRLVDDLGMDSYSAIELTFELEDKLNVNTHEKDLAKLSTVSDIVNYVVAKVKKA